MRSSRDPSRAPSRAFRVASGAARRDQPLVPDDLPIGSLVTALSPTKRDPRRVGVKVGGRYAGALPADLIEALGLKVGMVWTEEADEALRFALERDKARRYAIASVSQRSTSRSRLAQALTRRGHSPAIIETTLNDLAQLGLLDDRNLAESIARSLLARSPSGPRLIEQKLIARGIDRHLAKAVAFSACETRDPLDDAIALAMKKLRSVSRNANAAATQRRLYAALARRGFDAEVSKLATQQAMAAARHESDAAFSSEPADPDPFEGADSDD